MKLSVDQIMRKAAAAAQKGEKAEAEQLYRMVLAKFPANKRAQEGLQSLSAARLDSPPVQDMQAVFALYNQGNLAGAAHRVSELQGAP